MLKKTLKTSTIPIEYNASTKTTAYELQRIINGNPFIFQDLLSDYKSISTLKAKKNTLKVDSPEGFATYLEDWVPLYFARVTKNFSENPAQLTELFKFLILVQKNLFDKKFLGYANEETFTAYVNSVYSLMAQGYYAENNAKLIDFIMEPRQEEKDKILEWLKGKYNFLLLNNLLDTQLQLLADKNQLDFLTKNVSQIASLVGEEFDKDLENAPKEDLPELSSAEFNNLCIDFLRQVDPSLVWLDVYAMLRSSGRIIYDNSYGPNCCIINTEDKGMCIACPLKGNISDFRNFIHEFIHFIVLDNQVAGKDPEPAIDEFPSILFELLALEYLKNKGYDSKKVDSLSSERKDWSIENAFDIYPTLQYLEDYLANGPITLAREQERVGDKATKEEIEEAVSFEIEYLLEHPTSFTNEYPYVISNYLAQRALPSLLNNPNQVYTAVGITNNLRNETIETITSKLSLADTPLSNAPTKPSVKIKTIEN